LVCELIGRVKVAEFSTIENKGKALKRRGPLSNCSIQNPRESVEGKRDLGCDAAQGVKVKNNGVCVQASKRRCARRGKT